MRCIGNCEICKRCGSDAAIGRKTAVCLPDGFVPDYSEKEEYGISVDIGTTTVAASLRNLQNGKFMAETACLNPQAKYGADVVSRIVYTINRNKDILHKEIIDCVNQIINELIVETGIKRGKIAKISVCGNTVMSHLFYNKPVEGLSKAPFTPYFYTAEEFNAEDIGIKINGKINIMPNIGSFVGSDTTAAILACQMLDTNKTTLLIDIGTNGEIALCRNKRILAASTAAGPAFEGAGIKNGMRAGKGAVEEIRFVNNDVELKAVGGGEPVGICGSGIIDIVSKLITIGIIDKTGRIISRSEAAEKNISKKIIDRIKETKTNTEFALYKSISINQRDIRELQLAKGAVYAGILTLLNEEGIDENQIDNIYIAGAFGNFINKKSALTIKLIPKVSADKIKFMGNSAGIGAAMFLLSEKSRKKAYKIAGEAQHIELSENEFFNNNYINLLEF